MTDISYSIRSTWNKQNYNQVFFEGKLYFLFFLPRYSLSRLVEGHREEQPHPKGGKAFMATSSDVTKLEHTIVVCVI